MSNTEFRSGWTGGRTGGRSSVSVLQLEEEDVGYTRRFGDTANHSKDWWQRSVRRSADCSIGPVPYNKTMGTGRKYVASRQSSAPLSTVSATLELEEWNQHTQQATLPFCRHSRSAVIVVMEA